MVYGPTSKSAYNWGDDQLVIERIKRGLPGNEWSNLVGLKIVFEKEQG